MFTITKGIENNYVFTIKADGSTLPLEIKPDYTFRFYLRKLSDDSIVDLHTVSDITSSSGRVPLTISASVTNDLESDKGPKEDRYYSKPTYSLIIDCDTKDSVNGKFIAKVPEVIVE